MQCKDIPDLPILEFLLDLESRIEWPTAWGTWFIYETEGQRSPRNCVARAMPLKEDTPEKLIRAKMARLIQRGLVEGCPCGCRGDYELTDMGRSLIAAKPAQ